jgi:sulfur carrier protein ThiS
MTNITLVLVPGPGARSVQVSAGTTLAQFAADHSLNNRQLIVDGEGVPRDQWSSTTLDNATEVFATGTVKGN